MTAPPPPPPPPRGRAIAAVGWLKKLALPPGGPLVAALLCLGWPGPWAVPDPWRGAGLAASLVALWLTSTPWLGLALLRRLERHPPLDLDAFEARSGRDALVVLDAGRYVRPGGDGDVKPETLERLRHAAALHRRTGLPILAAGDGAGPLMATVLREDFGVETRWLEVTSRTTQENADLAAELLTSEGIDRAVLVTHAWHMRRAVASFARTPLGPPGVVAAPFGFAGPDRQELRLLMLVPSAGGLQSTTRALHEWIGLVWYRLRHGVARAR
ncbi:MAG: YdcF family protein [Acidobacteriota bacterium]